MSPDALGNRLDDCGVCTLLPTVTGTVRAEQATCPVHGTWPYAPRSAPPASSQALPADQDTHPAVRAGQDAYMELLRTGDGCPGSHDVAAAVVPAVLRWVELVRFGERADPELMWHCCEVCRGRAEVIEWLRRQAAEITAAASSVPTGTPESAPRRLPGNQPLVLRDLTITPIPGNPTNGDDTDD